MINRRLKAYPVPVLPINGKHTCGKDMGQTRSTFTLDHGHKS
jgi:hypothetical protein